MRSEHAAEFPVDVVFIYVFSVLSSLLGPFSHANFNFPVSSPGPIKSRSFSAQVDARIEHFVAGSCFSCGARFCKTLTSRFNPFHHREACCAVRATC